MCDGLTAQAVCDADTTCQWIGAPRNECVVLGDGNDAIFDLAYAKTDAVSVEFKTKADACDAVTAQSSCTSANDCEWVASGSECRISDAYITTVETKFAASSASTSFVAVQELVVAAVAAALLA